MLEEQRAFTPDNPIVRLHSGIGIQPPHLEGWPRTDGSMVPCIWNKRIQEL